MTRVRQTTIANDYDAELSRHNQRLCVATAIGRADQVLDVGCGTGQTTRDAARGASAGSVLGVDVSEQMVARARRLTEEAGLHNVTYEVGDAEVHEFQPESFDVVISRFGTMFFADPVAAFRNIARAMRPGGRLVMMVWQEHERNEWSVSIQRSLSGSEPAPTAPPGAPDPFSLADPIIVKRIFSAAGFADAEFTDVREPVYYGQDVAAALDWVRGFSYTKDLLRQLGPASAERALERLREAVAAHDSGRGVWFDSRAWIVTASRR
jgi:ubiquinone/menaquinone biosynthesis C-methylase UbiE